MGLAVQHGEFFLSLYSDLFPLKMKERSPRCSKNQGSVENVIEELEAAGAKGQTFAAPITGPVPSLGPNLRGISYKVECWTSLTRNVDMDKGMSSDFGAY